MPRDLQPRRPGIQRRDESAERSRREKRHQRLQRRVAVQLAEAQLEIRACLPLRR